MNILTLLQQATLAARVRRQDYRIGTDVCRAGIRIVRVKGASVTPLTGPLTLAKAIAYLEAM